MSEQAELGSTATTDEPTIGRAPQEARLAKSVPSVVQVALIKVCEATPEIAACLLFDVRERGNPGAEVNVLIELVLDEGASLEEVAKRFEALIVATPSLSGRTYFASTGQFAGLMKQALYRRPCPHHG